jgi:hypothetical protein
MKRYSYYWDFFCDKWNAQILCMYVCINKILGHVTIYRVYHVVIEEFFDQVFYFGKPLFYEMRVNVFLYFLHFLLVL